MKTLKSLGVALALTVSALGFASNAQAQSKESPNYYLIGLNEAAATVISGDIASVGEARRAWVFGYFARPIQGQEGAVKALWILSEFNCTSNQVRPITVELVNPEGEIIATFASQSVAETPPANSSMALGLAVACGRESEAIPLTSDEAVDLLVRYDAANEAQ